MSSPPKARPLYVIASIDHALQLASILQMEGSLTVAAAAERLGVARSTAHRMLQMLVYRDFAWQDELRVYRPGPLMAAAAQSPARVAELREAALPVLRRLSATIEGAVDVSVRVGDTVRLIAGADRSREVRQLTTEGTASALHDATTGLLYLASQPTDALTQYLERHPEIRRQRTALRLAVERARRTGFATTSCRSEHGLIAVGVPVVGLDGGPFAGLSVSMPGADHDIEQARQIVSLLRSASAELSRDRIGQRPRIGMAG